MAIKAGRELADKLGRDVEHVDEGKDSPKRFDAATNTISVPERLASISSLYTTVDKLATFEANTKQLKHLDEQSQSLLEAMTSDIVGSQIPDFGKLVSNFIEGIVDQLIKNIYENKSQRMLTLFNSESSTISEDQISKWTTESARQISKLSNLSLNNELPPGRIQAIGSDETGNEELYIKNLIFTTDAKASEEANKRLTEYHNLDEPTKAKIRWSVQQSAGGEFGVNSFGCNYRLRSK
jgi:hypothetical protein